MTMDLSEGTNYTQDSFKSETCGMDEMHKISSGIGANAGTGLK